MLANQAGVGYYNSGEDSVKMHYIPDISRALCVASALVAIVAATASASATQPTHAKPPFSVEALQYLLQRQEYDRFDWYIARYLRHHPDTAVLYLIRAYRYFDQAIKTEVHTRHVMNGKTGGIPRKYPEYVAPRGLRVDFHTFPVYNDNLLARAFASMRMARSLEPHRRDLYTGICHMAVQAHQPGVLAAELDSLLQRFPCDDEIVSMVTEYSKKNLLADNPALAIRLLKRTLRSCTDNQRIVSEIGRAYYTLGELDSAYRYTLSAHYLAPDDPEALNRAMRLSSIRGEYKAGARLALKRYAVTREAGDLEQAVLFSELSDSAASADLRARLSSAADFDSSSSLYYRFKRLLDAGARDTVYFSDSLYHLNFPLIEMRYRQSDDRITYYLHKAGAFYAVALYDSAAYYNLNLLRNLNGERNLGLSAGFNLAAEYYASGRHMLAFQRFLKLYKYHPYPMDIDLHYALAVNYEIFGDIANARMHYRKVVRNKGDNREKAAELRRMAQYRLEHMQALGAALAR